MLYMVSFGVAVLAAFGAERAVHRDVGRRYLIGWAIAVLGIGVIGAMGGLTNLGVAVAQAEQTNRVLENDAAVRGGALRSTLFGAMTLVPFLLATGRVGRQAGGYLLAGIVAVDLWSVERFYWQFSPPASVLFASDETIEYVKRQPEPEGSGSQRPTPGSDPYIRRDAR
jgi:xanthine/uracil/vitamin C permease (AzgA family)